MKTYFYVQGSRENQKNILKVLKELGGRNVYNLFCGAPTLFYGINENGVIDSKYSFELKDNEEIITYDELKDKLPIPIFNLDNHLLHDEVELVSKDYYFKIENGKLLAIKK